MLGDRVFLGWTLRERRGPLVVNHRGHPAATWPWGTVPHGLVVGSTGGGKTTLLRVAATDLVRTPGRRGLYLADGKGGDSFMAFHGLPGVVTCSGPVEVAEAVGAVHEELQARLRRLAQARQTSAATRTAGGYAAPADLFLWLDEYMAWVLALEGADRGRVIGQLTRIGLLGREVGVRLLLAMQRPDARSVEVGLPGSLKAQLKARIAAAGLMGMDSLEARMAFDDPAYADRVPMQPGGGLIRVGRHEVAFRVPWMADPTDPTATQADRAAAWRLLPHPAEPGVGAGPGPSGPGFPPFGGNQAEGPLRRGTA